MQKAANISFGTSFSKTVKESLHSTQSISGRASILTYDNKQYPSATDALQAYIADFDNKQSTSPYKCTVEDLLSPKSVLLQTVERSLATGVRDTHAETKRHKIKRLIDDSYHEILRADIEQDKAKQLIESSKQLPSVARVPSDLSNLTPEINLHPYPSLTSLSTDTLLLQASQSSENHRLGFTSELQHSLNSSQISRHLSPLQESYRANAIQLKSLQSRSGRNIGILKKSQERKRGYREVSFNSSTKSRYSIGSINAEDDKFGYRSTGTMTTEVKSPDKVMTGNDNSNQNTSHRNGKLADECILSGGRIVPSWIDDVDMLDKSSLDTYSKPPVSNTDITSKVLRDGNQKSNMSEISGERNVPSWIENMSEIQNTGDGRSDIGRVPPSWINDLNTSELSSAIPTVRQFPFDSQSRVFRSRDNFLSRGDTSLPPGLTHQDLSSTSPNKENILKTNSNTSRQPKIKTSAEINRLVRNSMAEQGVRKFQSASPLPKRKISSDIMSMTTDDLILAPSTGRGLPESKSMEELRITLKEMDSIPTRSFGRSTGITNRRRLQKSLEDSEHWQRHLPQKSSSVNDSHDKSRLNLSELYLSPSKYPSRKVYKNQPPFITSSSKARTKRNEDTSHSQRHEKYFSWRGGLQHTGRFTSPRGSSKDYEQRVIDRAEKILGSPLTRPYHSLLAQSPNTEDILDGDRSWEKAVPPYKPLTPVYGVDGEDYRRTKIIDRFLDDCLNSNSTSPRLTTGDQPGTVEALKNMLFTIQSVAVANDLTEDDDDENKTEENDNTLQHTSIPRVVTPPKVDLVTKSDLDIQSEGSMDTEHEGSKSLKRAMEHLSRLKYLVRSDSENTL